MKLENKSDKKQQEVFDAEAAMWRSIAAYATAQSDEVKAAIKESALVKAEALDKMGASFGCEAFGFKAVDMLPSRLELLDDKSEHMWALLQSVLSVFDPGAAVAIQKISPIGTKQIVFMEAVGNGVLMRGPGMEDVIKSLRDHGTGIVTLFPADTFKYCVVNRLLSTDS